MNQSLGIMTDTPPPADTGTAAADPGNNGAATGGDPGPAAPADVFAPFKEKFGYQNPEEAIKEIEEFRASKANPPAPPEIKFENEASQKLFEAIKAGKTDDVQKILEQQHRYEHLTSVEVSQDTAPDIIKAAMQAKYPDLTQKEIDFKFNKQYGYPKEPTQGEKEYDEDFEARKKEWEEKVSEIDMERIIEAKAARPALAEAKQKLVLPEIPASKDEAYEQWKAQQAGQPGEPTPEQIMEAYKDVTPEKLAIAIPFKDETNKVDFNFQFTPSAEQHKQALEVVADFPKFFSHFQKSDGSLDREGFVRALVFAMNAETIMGEALNQAKNGTIKSKLPDNSSAGLVRSLPGNLNQEPSELDRQMQQSLQVR